MPRNNAKLEEGPFLDISSSVLGIKRSDISTDRPISGSTSHHESQPTDNDQYKLLVLATDDPKDDIEEGRNVYQPGGFHPVYIGEIYDEKYKILSKIGYGQYSTVWLVEDLLFSQDSRDPARSKYYALKVLSAECYHTDNPLFEREILMHLRSADPSHPGHKSICHLVEDFKHEGPNGIHVCLVFELMGETLQSFPRFFKSELVPNAIMRKFTMQLLMALDYSHDNGVIHTDIKPDNIFVKFRDTSLIESEYLPSLVLPIQYRTSKWYIPIKSMPLSKHYFAEDDNFMNFDVVLGDWGVAWCKSQHLSGVIQPVALRAPEVIIGASWDETTDWWNLGVVLLEVFRAVCMFSGRARTSGCYDPTVHLYEIIRVFGPFPKTLLDSGDSEFVGMHFDENGFIKGRNGQRHGINPDFSMDGLSIETRDDFISFLRLLMKIDPKERVSTMDLLEHPWVDAFGDQKKKKKNGVARSGSDESPAKAGLWEVLCGALSGVFGCCAF